MYRVRGSMRFPLQTRLDATATLARRGVLRPTRPDKALRQGIKLWRWGATLAAAYVVHSVADAEQVALCDDEGELTYAGVNLRTNALADSLRRLGVREGDSVAILCRNGRGFVEPVIACSKLGADALFLNTSFSPQEVQTVVARERPRALVYEAELASLVEGTPLPPEVIRVVAGAADPAPGGDPTLERLIAEGDTAEPTPPEHESRTVILTSGTTGPPKGARVARPENMDPLAWLLKVLPLRPRSPYLIAAPLFHAHGFGQFSIGSGLTCEVVLTAKFDPERTLALIERRRVEVLAAVPVMLKRMMELPAETRARYDTSSLRVVLCSGSALPADLTRSFMDAFGPVIYNLYGSTEVSAATIATPQDLLDAPGTVGRPLPHSRVAILDDDGRALPPGEIGLIFVGHEMLFDGYTDGSSLAGPAGMMSPGDLGHVDSEGRVFVDARKDDMIISGGENVYPGEVEAALQEHPDVDQIAALGVDDEQFGQRLVVFVVPRPGSGLTEEGLQAFAKQSLARFKVPREVHLVEELPRNALGKVVKRELQALL